jgi:anti-anti-sigma factor
MMERADDEIDVAGSVDTGSLSIACRREGTEAVVVLAGELDLAGGDALEAAAARLVADGVDDLSIQAEGVTFIDSSGLGGLLAARAIVIEAGGELRFGPTTDAVARVIELAGVTDLLGLATA